jgi:hypothetical protein
MSEEARSGAPLIVVADDTADGAGDESLERLSLALHRADRRFRILKAERHCELPRLASRHRAPA